jgi:hypothetical protein
MNPLEEQILELCKTLALSGKPIIGDLAATVNDCIAIRPNDGLDNVTYLGSKSSVEYPFVRLYIRNSDYVLGKNDVYAIKDAMAESALPCSLVGNVVFLGNDTEGRAEFMLNYKGVIVDAR